MSQDSKESTFHHFFRIVQRVLHGEGVGNQARCCCGDTPQQERLVSLLYDRGVIALTGKGLELRATKSPHLLDGKEYDRIVHLRNAECNRRYQETMRLAAEAIGQEWKPTKTSMMAKDDHSLIVAQYITIALPVLQKDAECVGSLEAKGPFKTNQLDRFQEQFRQQWITLSRTIYSL